MLLRDEDIYALLKSTPPLVTNVTVDAEDYTADSWVQSASLDLHVGNIYVPETDPEKSGGINNPKSSYVLEAGHTVVIETKEILDLPDSIAAIGFPPSRISARGVLTTNPGHVDAGYKGHLSLTIINMGRTSFEIRSGDMMLTLLFFRMSGPTHASYRVRVGNRQDAPAVSEDRMSRLSRDFLQVEARAERVARNEESKTRRWAVVVPALVAALALAGTLGAAYLQNHSTLANEIHNQETEIAVLKQQVADLSLRHSVSKPKLSPLRLAIKR